VSVQTKLKDAFGGGNKRYDYQRGVGKIKIVALSLFVLLLVIGVSFAGSMTGFMVYTDSLQDQASGLEAQLLEANNRASALTNEKTSCINELNKMEARAILCESDLGTANSDFNDCTKARESLEASLNSCISDKAAVTEAMEKGTASYKELVRSSVQSKCCSISDIISGAGQHWTISDGGISCAPAGVYMVNCTTGATDY
jgi:hypothetical protein